MRDYLPDGFITAIKNDTLRVCESYELTLRNGKVYRYCTHDDDLDWGNPSKRYYSAPIKRTTVSSSMNLEVDSTEISISGITEELFDICNTNVMDNVSVVIKRHLWDEGSASGMEFTVFVGIGNVNYNRNEIKLPLYSILSTLNILVPKNSFQQPCNYTIFDVGCTLVMADYKVSSTASADSENGYTVLDAAFTVPPTDPYKFNTGELHVTSGNNQGEKRCVLNAVDGMFTLAVSLPYNMESGDTFDYYPGCDGTPETCRDRFNNLPNFYGFPYLPGPEESM